MLRICTFIRKIAKSLIRRLKRKSEGPEDDELTEVTSVRELGWHGSSDIHQHASVFIIPSQLNAPLQIEDIED